MVRKQPPELFDGEYRGVCIVQYEKVRALAASGYSVMRWQFVAVLLLLVSACVATGEKKEIQVNAGQQGCSAEAATPPQTTGGQAAGNVAPKKCLPKGVIEISEAGNVNPEVRDEFNRAVVLLNEEKYVDAIRLLKGVVGKTSKFSAPYINLGIAYARTDEYQKAEENLKKALEVNSLHPVASNELGMVYRKTGRYQDARKTYEALIALYPDFLPARKNYGILCDIYLQDLPCALQQYEEYLKGLPDDEKVKIWMVDVKSRM